MIPTSLKSNFWKISVVTSVVSGSYFLGSVFLYGTNFYIFDAIWRMSIIVAAIFILRFNPNFQLRQYLSLGVLFVLEYILYKVFSPSVSFLSMSISAILAPLAEELFFRGWVMNQIEGSKKEKIVYSSIFFSLYHLKNTFVLTPFSLAYQLLYALLVAGPVLGWIRLRYDSIFASIVFHSVNNSLAELMTTRIFPALMKRSKNF